MAELLTNKEHLAKFGFCIVRNLLDEKEIKQYRSAISKLGNNVNRMETIKCREIWKYYLSDRLLNILNNLLGTNVYWLHDMSVKHANKNDLNANSASWHRDNACRVSGKGPDWDEDEPYKVVNAITYLSPYKETGSGVSLIPFSHKKTYARTFSNMLRLFHWKTRNIKFLQGIRNKIQNYISVTCRMDSGDCAIFFCSVFHEALPNKSIRQAIIGRFGPMNKHSKNYVNYVLKHRKNDYEINDGNKAIIDDFFNLLKSKNIYFPLPEKKEDIKGVTVPKEEY